MNRDRNLISAAMLIWGIGDGLFALFQPLYLEQLGADPLKIGSLIGLASLAAMLSFLPVGYLTDRYGQIPLLRAAFLIGAIAAIQMAATSTLSGFTIGMVFYGFTAFFNIPMSSFLTTVRGKSSIARVLTLNAAFFNIGAAIGSVWGGILGEKYGLQLNFQAAVPFFILSTSLIFFIRPQQSEISMVSTSEKGLKSLWRSRFPIYVFLTFLIMFGMYLPQPLSQNFLQNERQVDLETIGQLIAARSIGIVVLNLILGQLNARVGMLISQVSMGLFAVFIWLGTGFPFYIAGYLLIGSFITARGLVIAQGRVLVNSANVSMAYGVLETIIAITMVLGPPAAGALYAIHPELTYSVSLCVIIIGILTSLLISPVRSRDLALFEEHEKMRWTQS